MAIPWEAIQELSLGVIEIKGIYIATNKINGKSYIGQSVNIESRIKEHLYRYNMPSSNSYNSLFYRAMRKYGKDNFQFSTLESSDEFDREALNDLEIFYINHYNSFHAGYNMNRGGNYTSGTKTFVEKDILEIKSLLSKGSDSLTSIAEKYSCSVSLVSMINNGLVWRSVGVYSYPIHSVVFSHSGGRNNNSKISDDLALKLREEFVFKTLDEIYEENKDLLSKSGMKKLLYGVTFKNLPIYKKNKKQWFLDGTCIDYPRLEE